MRNQLAKLFRKLANKLSPLPIIPEKVENYEAKKIGKSIRITKKELKDNRNAKRYEEHWGCKKSDAVLMSDVKKEIAHMIVKSIYDNRLIEYTTEKDNEDIIVSAELKVYIKKEEEQNEKVQNKSNSGGEQINPKNKA